MPCAIRALNVVRPRTDDGAAMKPASTLKRYGWISITLHWVTLLLIAAAYATMEFKSVFPKGSAAREAMAHWHYVLGLAVFALAWLRLVVRTSGDELIDSGVPAYQAQLRRIVHWSLYALMIGLPLVGWMTLNAKGTPVAFLGYELPMLLSENRTLARSLKDVHEILARSGYFVVGLHAAAALYHHYVKRDDTLRRMLYGR
jgi:cytochrome b561